MFRVSFSCVRVGPLNEGAVGGLRQSLDLPCSAVTPEGRVGQLSSLHGKNTLKFLSLPVEGENNVYLHVEKNTASRNSK